MSNSKSEQAASDEVFQDLYKDWKEKAYPVERPERTIPPPATNHITIHPAKQKQAILGLGFEIQSDSISSGNSGLPEEKTSVPHDLTADENERFADEMLRGFRYCRLAGGLFWRGLDAEGKTLQPRWPQQLEELRSLFDRSGVEGVQLEYWSPPSFWKTNRKLYGFPWDGPRDPHNQLRCWGEGWESDPDYAGDTERFLLDFTEAQLQDVRTLQNAGIKVSMWGLTNEPQANTAYASCKYTEEQWAETWKHVGPAIREAFPEIKIVADSAHDGVSFLGKLEELYPEAAALVDYITVHTIGYRSKTVLPTARRVRDRLKMKRPVFQNEYEYLAGPTSPDRCLNTVNNILNWFQLTDSPSWFWIHALKPVMNSESSGYCLGFWMPAEGIDEAQRAKLPPHLANLKPGSWTWNPYNWNAVVGFLKHLPWDSVALEATEETIDADARMLAFKTPTGKHGFVVSNHTTADLALTIETGQSGASFKGYRYTPDDAGLDFCGIPQRVQQGPIIKTSLPDRTWEFWLEA